MTEAPKIDRSSHFVLGNNSQKSQFTSTMKMNFQQGAQPTNPIPKGPTTHLRASHFELGGLKNTYQTSFQTQYKPHFEFDSAKLNEEKMHDLRTNHFVLGHLDGQRVSSTQQTYTAKPLSNDVNHEKEVQKKKMRAHHHKFAETEAKAMRTYYNEQYQPYGQQNQHREDLVEKANTLRQSHIILGKEQQGMQTIQQSDFSQKDRVANFVKVVSGKSHIAFGVQDNDFQTTNQVYAVQSKGAERVPVEQNIRATHFKMGQEAQPYVTEMNQHYRPITQQVVPQRVSMQAHKNNFEIGDARFPKLAYQTHYNATMKPPETAPAEDQGQKRNDRSSNFVVGNSNGQFRSEFNSHFGNVVDGKAAALDTQVMKDLRSSHFRFNDTTNNYKTTSAQAYNNGVGRPNKLDPHAEANLRSHHFVLGQTSGSYISAMHQVHVPLESKPNISSYSKTAQRTQNFQLN